MSRNPAAALYDSPRALAEDLEALDMAEAQYEAWKQGLTSSQLKLWNNMEFAGVKVFTIWQILDARKLA
jgi:hypothetical protein